MRQLLGMGDRMSHRCNRTVRAAGLNSVTHWGHAVGIPIASGLGVGGWMDRFGGLAAFVRGVETGSLYGRARRLRPGQPAASPTPPPFGRRVRRPAPPR